MFNTIYYHCTLFKLYRMILTRNVAEFGLVQNVLELYLDHAPSFEQS